jgi:hypothetical protein
MPTVLAYYRNGAVELDGPVPAEWTDGAGLRIDLEPAESGIDITGDSPEAIAAWLKWYEEFAALPRDEEAILELEEILRRNKEEGKAMFEAHCRSAEELFR